MFEPKTNIAITAFSWFKEDNYIKIMQPKTQRNIILSGIKADVFELFDEGYEKHEVVRELERKYGDVSITLIDDIIKTFQDLDLLCITTQFES